MDDLSGLMWNSSSEVNKPTTPRYPNTALRPSPPISRGATPSSQPSARSVSPAKSTTPGSDSFANLVNFGSGTNEKSLSLAERQQRLAEQKAREEREKRAQLDAQFGQNNGELWSRLETAGSTQSSGASAQPANGRQPVANDDEDDLLAAFNASAPVDTSTNFPVPSSSSSSRPDSSALNPVRSHTSTSKNIPPTIEVDDDPFGLTELEPKPVQQESVSQVVDEDDILGPLAKPVSEFPRQQPDVTTHETSDETTSVGVDESIDKPIAELVDMGFPVEDARAALAATETGTDIQAAVGWLLNRAHSESQQKAKSKDRRITQETGGLGGHRESSADRTSGRHRESGTPAWMRGNDQSYDARFKTPSRDGAAEEKDPAKLAAEFGNNLFKSANSLWKTGTKRMQQAVQEFNGPSDPSQPRWMRDAAEAEAVTYQERRIERHREPSQANQANASSGHSEELVTDEAIMLESRPSPPTKSHTPSPGPQPPAQRPAQYKSRSPALASDQRASSPHAIPQNGIRNNNRDASTSRLTRLGADEDAGQAYISPARRRKGAPSRPTPESQPDLLQASSVAPEPKRQPSPLGRPQSSSRSAPIQVRPKAAPRSIPPIQPSSLQASTQHRQKGTDAFKRGDYAAAHASYSHSLSLVPEKHPIAIVLLSNRALTSLKIGEPKSAISDADRAISIVGPEKGESEKIDLGGGEPSKNMKEFFGKALMRKAEALEQLERWADAAKVWQEAVESGHGGSTSIHGRNRCEKATGTRQSSSSSTPVSSSNATPSKPTRQPVKRPAAPTSVKPAEAVTRLRAANDAADRADGEKFALSDAVDARVTAWKGGKQDNLRALLSSLETVLWPEAQWKKINMSELLLPNKVKIQYMKGISKVHPDKIPVDATTEQKMIAGAVFSTLNEAWDKFKRENGL